MQFFYLQLFPFFVMLIVCFSFLVLNGESRIELPKNNTISALFVFGDSIVDTGNNNNLKTFAKANFPPYGQDFLGGKPTGRFCNGKVPSDLIAEELGIKPLLPAYLDPSLQPQDLITGVNFASGGAGYDPLTSYFAGVYSLSHQLDMFKEYIMKLKGIVGEERASKILRESLIVVVTGSNDITNTYFGTPTRKLSYDVRSYADFMVGYASNFVQDLYKLGPRRIGVLGLPPLGCVPSQRTLRGGVTRKCVASYNQACEIFNNKLSTELNLINTRLAGARMIYLDIYYLPLDIIQNPKKYGFGVSNLGCCGSGTIEVVFLCRYTCSNVLDYVFWDSFHLTENAYRIVVHELLKQRIKDFFP